MKKRSHGKKGNQRESGVRGQGSSLLSFIGTETSCKGDALSDRTASLPIKILLEIVNSYTLMRKKIIKEGGCLHRRKEK